MSFLKNIILASLFCISSVAHADVTTPDGLIESTVQEVIQLIKQDKDIRAGDRQKILALVDAKVLPHFDFERMTQLAVGKYWRQASPAQKQELVVEFRNMLVRTYTKVFTVYQDQTVEVKPLKSYQGDASNATVNTLINKPGAQSIPVDYELRKSDQGWKVFDITVEGVSMVMSYRGTFSSQIQQVGIDGLIKTMANKNTDTN